MDPSITAPVRGRELKKKKITWRTLSWITIASLVVIFSIYFTYWNIKIAPNILEEKEQKAFDLNQTLILQGIQETFDLITELRINCQPLTINYTNQNNESILLSYIPVEGCMSQDQINCFLENE